MKFDVKKLVKELKSDFADTICLIGDASSPTSLAPKRIPTGSINLDWATGGGIPTGRITELYSRKESEGKSSLACSIIRQAQKLDAQVMYLDTEQVSMGTRLTALGVDMKNLVYVQPESVEHALAITDKYIRKAREMGHKGFLVVVIDSIAAMNTEAQLEGNYDAAQIASLAQALSRGLRKLNQVVSDNDAVLLVTNQVRDRIGISYGETLITPGGKALKFYSCLRIELKTKEKIYEQEKGTKKTVGITVTATVKKNKVGMPFQAVDLDLIFASGFDPAMATFRFCLMRKLITRDGNAYKFAGIKKGFTKSGFRAFMEANPEVDKTIYEELDKSLQEVTNIDLAEEEDENKVLTREEEEDTEAEKEDE